MSSDSRKRSESASAKKRGPCHDPARLAIVSDFLKRTISDRPYAFIMESLSERLELRKVDPRLSSVGIIPVPTDFDIRKFTEEKSLAFVPYCSKPFDCPLNSEHGRKSNICQATYDKCDHQSCSIGQFIKVARRLGIQEFHVIATDAGLFEWLAQKRAEGYLHVIGVACEYAVSYALEVIHGQLGYDGFIITITGDKCKTKEEYSESDAEDRDRLTFIDEWSISTLDELITQMLNSNGEPNGKKADVATR
ncbi:MAG: DUF116 domain-containing protein [Candidatus Thermoplasmatota archaeon]|nr:DUF116 domain-containing protein [Candidatus Thermoplasmatota archaeon]